MSKTILVVDDEKDIRISLTGILEDEGYQVLTADNGIEALECARLELPDLVLLDIWMPGMDGLETLERLKTLFPQVTVIMISGHGTIETAVRATKLGAFDFIEKPLSLDKVLISVVNALRMKELRVENEELKRVVANEYEMIGSAPVMAAPARTDHARRAHDRVGAGDRGERHRQGAGCAFDPLLQPAPRQALCRHQLRRHTGGADRERAVRP